MTAGLDVLYYGFPGKANLTYLGWSTIALLKTNGRNILLDTGGSGARAMLIQALEDRGMSADDIDGVFLSHLHFDHAANCLLFPKADFYLSRLEWEHANEGKDIFVQEAVISVLNPLKKVFIEKDAIEIFSGVSAIFTPGHTPGSVTLIGGDEGEKWAFAGDAIKNRSELSGEGFGITANSAVSMASVEKVKKMVSRVLPGHEGWLSIKEGQVYPEGKNEVTLTMPQGITCNGQSSVTLYLDG